MLFHIIHYITGCKFQGYFPEEYCYCILCSGDVLQVNMAFCMQLDTKKAQALLENTVCIQ